VKRPVTQKQFVDAEQRRCTMLLRST